MRKFTITLCLLLTIVAIGMWRGTNDGSASNDIRPIPYETVTPVANSSPECRAPRWVPATYRGLVLGQSTYNDVKRLWGTPRWEGENEEEEFANDPKSEILMQYSSSGEGKEAAQVLVDSDSKIVNAITYIPDPDLTRSQAVEKFGSDYFEISTGSSLCIEADKKRGVSSKKLSYPILLVYPEKGMYISLYEDESVMHIGYSHKCIE